MGLRLMGSRRHYAWWALRGVHLCCENIRIRARSCAAHRNSGMGAPPMRSSINRCMGEAPMPQLVRKLPLHRHVNMPARVLVIAEKGIVAKLEIPLAAFGAALVGIAKVNQFHRADPALLFDGVVDAL